MACVQSMKEKVVFSMMQALLAMGDIDSALMSLTKASNIEPNDGYVILGSELEVVCTVVIRGFCH